MYPMAKGSVCTGTAVLEHSCLGAGHGNSVEFQTCGLANPGICVPAPAQVNPILSLSYPCLPPLFRVNAVDNVTQLSL